MYKRVLIIILVVSAAALAGCAAVLGTDEGSEEAYAEAQIRLVYAETLRDQESLRGESLRDVKTYDDPVKAAQALQRPSAVAADPFRVYVTDRAPSGRLVIFDRGLRTMASLTAPVLPATISSPPYLEPTAVALDEAGYVYVADAGRGRVYGLDRSGALLFTIGNTGELSYPAALAVDKKQGRLYVADRNANSVLVYAARGRLLFRIGSSGRKGDLRRPVGVAVDRDGQCYVLDGARNRVRLYDANGAFLKAFRVSSGMKGAAVRLTGIAINSAGHIYVVDQLNSVIIVLDKDGTLLRRWGRMGNSRDEFWNPSGIFIDGQDAVYVADQMNGRIQVYQHAK